MRDWWIGLTMHQLAGIIVFLLILNLTHQWVILVFKWIIYRSTIRYLKAAENEQIENYGILQAMKDLIKSLNGWAELVRINTSKTAFMSEDVKNEIQNKADVLESKIDQVPEKVAANLNDSGIQQNKGG